MRYLDELLALYTGKDPFTRKFILAQLLDQPPDSHSEQVVELLWGESRDADAVVRRQARYSLGQYLPAHARFTYGLSAADEPILRDGGALPGGAAVALKTALERVLHLLDAGSPIERVAASLVLGRIHSPQALSLLRDSVSRADLSYMAGFSLAESGEESAVEALVAACDAHGKSRPDLYMLLRGLPCAATFECLAAHEERADPAGRANIALALAHFAAAESRPLLERLVRRREGWVTAYVLDTVAGHGEPEDLPLIRLAYELEQHEFIRVQAVRAAGGIKSDAARAFCLELLASSTPRVQAAALEALYGQEMDTGELARLAEPHLAAEFPRTRYQAMLAVGRHDPDRAAGLLTQVILAHEALLRLEGAYLTGLLRPPGGLALLERMATSDPSMSVRMQAVKSLARWGPGEALPVLGRLLATPQRPLLLTVCRTLTGVERPAAVVEVLTGALAGLPGASSRAAALKSLGHAARLANLAPPAALLEAVEDADALIKIGALEGLKYFGDAIPVQSLRRLLDHADPRVRARAALGGFLAGHPGDAGALAPMLASGDETQVLEGLSALLEVASVAPFLERGPFGRLRDALAPLAPAAPAPEPAPAPEAKPPPRPTSKTRPVPSLRRTDVLSSLSGAQVLAVPAQTDLAKLSIEYSQKSIEGLTESATNVKLPSMPVPDPSGGIDLSKSGVIQRPVAKGTGRERTLSSPRGDAGGLKRAGVALAVVAIGLLAAVGGRLDDGGVLSDPTRPQASATIAQRTAVRVWSVTGTCGTLGPDGRLAPLRVGGYLKAGDRIGTDANGRLEVRFQDGSAVTLGPGSRITTGAAVERSDKGPLPAVLLDDPTGDVTVEAKGIELQVKSGAGLYRTKGGRARLMNGTIEQQDGDGTLVRGDARQVLVAGQSAPL